jgi:PAB-dependent poly(A)-specific ribonuclease subunit 3
VSYAYYPNAKTLYDTHIKPNLQQPPPLKVSGSSFYQTRQPPRQQRQVQPQQPYIPERTLWSYIIQIASAIKKVHERDLAVQMVDVTKILVVGQNRVRIGSCGIVDVFLHDTPQDIRYLQREDLTMFGRLILILCTGNASSFTNSTQVQNALDTINRVYSREMQTLAVFFCSELNKTIDDVLKMVSKKILEEQEEALAAVDRLEDELMGELENARLVRLMAKFGFINERPEYALSLSLSSLLFLCCRRFARDPRWSETGDRYIIKLFRDYVFHQVDEHGHPLLDLTHVLVCLNKLDAGTDERVMLVARDEQSCLVVSYKEIKACISSAFEWVSFLSVLGFY